jgi:3-oxoadipate enol-lactonase
MIASINGADIYYEIAGAGRDVLFLHEGITDARMWDPQFDAFAATYRLIRCDLRGYSRSSLPGGPYSHFRDVKALLDLIGIDKTVVVGCSNGALVALQLALEYPDVVEALVLGVPGIDDHDWSDAIEQAEAAEEEAFERGDLEAVADVNLQTWVAGPNRSLEDVDPEVVERVRTMMMDSYRVQYAAYAEEPEPGPSEELDPSAGARLGELRVPVFVIAGEDDVADINAIARRIASNVPGAELHMIRGAAHLPNLEKPEEFNDLLRTFLGRVTS